MKSLLFLFIEPFAEGWETYLNYLLDFRNPVIFASIATLILIIILFISIRNTVLPQKNKMLAEQMALENKNLRLIFLFADLDPDPILRIDTNGQIIFSNPAAKRCGLGEIIGKPISSILSDNEIDIEELISNNKEKNLILIYSDRYYSIKICGVSYLNIAQIYMHDITELKVKETALEDSQKELKQFSRYLQNKIEEERKRISRELHDELGQKLVLLKINLQKDLIELTGSENSQVFTKHARMIDDAVRDVKDIAFSLRPSSLEEIGLYFALINLMERIEEKTCIKGKLSFIDISDRLEFDLETTIYRIVQEAISNIVKYAGVNEYDVNLKKRQDSLLLIISDSGKGFLLNEVPKNKGMGLKNMQERAEMQAGIFKISSSSEEGTIISVFFPLGGKI